MVSKRNFVTLLSTTTQSSNRLRKVSTIRPTCSQTETSSLSVPNVSVSRVFSSHVSLAKKPAESTTSSFHNNIKYNIYIRKDFVRHSNVVMRHEHVPRDFQEHDKGINGVSPSTMRSRWLLHQCENPQYGLEDLSCSSQHIPADVDLEGEYNYLARPSSTGSACELTILTLHFGATVFYGD